MKSTQRHIADWENIYWKCDRSKLKESVDCDKHEAYYKLVDANA